MKSLLGYFLVQVVAAQSEMEDLGVNVTSTDIPMTVATIIASQSVKVLPIFSALSFTAGLFVMLVFVLAPVGLMGYRNRNSIVEFIKNR